MSTIARVLRALSLGMWFGGGIMLFITAHYVFQVDTDRTHAGSIMAPILHTAGWLQVELAVVAVVLTLYLRDEDRKRGSSGRVVMAALAVGMLIALFMALWLEPRLVFLREQIGVFTDATLQNPQRQEFRSLHGLSMGLAVLETVAAGVALGCSSR